MPPPKPDDRADDSVKRAVEHALHAIGFLFEPGDIIEIRALDVGRTANRAGVTYSGYFNFENAADIGGAIRSMDGRAEGVYVALNRFQPGLLARANNRLQARPKNTTSDADITERRWLYIDLDANRPAGISATEQEKEAALERAVEVRAFLTSRGWPEPVLADSGNGAHLLYRLPKLEVGRAGELVKASLQVLAARFSDAAVTVDQSTATAARICKLYGTMVRKGDPMPNRPHRRARVIDEPEQITAVTVEALESLASEAESNVRVPAASRSNLSTQIGFDIDQWLAASGLEIIKGPEPYEGGRRWTLRACLFNPEHLKPVVIQLPGGALVYKCLHKSCAQNDWKALRLLIDPRYDLTRTTGTSPLQNVTPAELPPLIKDLSQIPSVWGLDARLDWIVQEMIAKGSVTLLCAESGTGKTWLGYYIAGCVARGIPILGRAVLGSKVLYLDGENPLYVVKQRLFDLGIEETPDLTIWGGWNTCPPPGPLHPLAIQFAREHQGLMIYDSLIEFHHGSEQSSTETRAFMRQFRTLANLGASVLVLHNTGKAETSKLYRGSSDIKAAVDTAYSLRRVDDGSQKLGKLSMTCFKGRLAPGQNFGLEFRDKKGFVACDHFTPVRTVEEMISEFLEAHPWSNQSKIVEAIHERGCGKGQIERCLKTGPWATSKGPNNSTLYNLPPEGAD